ncbi:hypothetical protein ACRQ5D_01940 [Mucilaginibacter sp. P25]|uniref:hypothetical protein n=2 Tax=unclassified Mucilaginibacter TaxID=2617802 RepID=UPI003D7BA651
MLVFQYKPQVPLLFKKEIFFIYASVTCSTVMAAVYHKQGLSTTLVTQRFMYFYLVYFALGALNVSSANVEKALKYTAIFFGCMYFLQYLVYPAMVFYFPKVQIERSTLRFRVDGFEFLIFLAAFSINRILNKNILFYPLLILSLVVNLLSGSRFLVAITVFTIGLVAFKSKNVSFGLKVFVVVLFALSVFFIIPSTYVSTITETTQKELAQGSDYIRIPAAYYYLTTYNTDIPTWIFGNGVYDANSSYGLQVLAIGENFGYYLGDIGFIGEFVRFGIFYFVVICVLLYRAIKHSLKVDPVLNSYLIGITVFYIISWPFGHAPGIILFSAVLYLIGKKRYEQNNFQLA